MSKDKLKALVWKEGSWFVARAIGLEVASQGKTRKEAIENLQEAIDLYLEDGKSKISPRFIPDDPQITSIYA